MNINDIREGIKFRDAKKRREGDEMKKEGEERKQNKAYTQTGEKQMNDRRGNCK